MQRYTINYFNQKETAYYGTLPYAIAYAEMFARKLVLSYKGDIVIKDEDDMVVAVQHWTEQPDGSSSASDWDTKAEPKRPKRESLWERHYTGYYIAKFTDGYHIIEWSDFRKGCDEKVPLHIADSRKAAKEWCVAHSKRTTRAQHHEQAIAKAIAYLEKNGYKVIKQ